MIELATADVLDWAREYDGELRGVPGLDWLAVALAPLKLGIRQAMARPAQRYEVRQAVSLAIVSEQAERNDVMDLLARLPAPLAGMLVAPPRRTTLGLPVCPVPVYARPVNKLWVKRANPVAVTAIARTETAAASSLGPTRVTRERYATTLAGERRFVLCGAHGVVGVLARPRTVAATPVSRSTGIALEGLSAPLAGIRSHGYKYRQPVGRGQV